MRSRRLASSFVLAFGLMTALLGPANGQSDVPGQGTWRVNVARSKLGPGPSPRSIISTVEPVGEHTRMTGVRVNADGQRLEARFLAKIDGKDYPIKGSVNAETVSLKRVDARTIERIDKRAGKVVETSRTVYSEDGKTATTTGKGICARGEEFEFLAFNERQ